MNSNYPWLDEVLKHPKSTETLKLHVFKKILEARLNNSHDFCAVKRPILKPKS